LKILFVLLLAAYSATIGSFWQTNCGIDVSLVDEIDFATISGRGTLPSEQLFDLAAVQVKEIPKGFEFIGSGLLGLGAAEYAPSFNVYRVAGLPDRYFMELYPTNVWNVDDEIIPCAVLEIELELN
jgi:hypothetical protein